MNTTAVFTEPQWVAGFMSGTSLDATDAAMILTDGERVLDFGPVAERKYTPDERQILQDATDAARAWNWTDERPEAAFAAACDVITRTHAEAFQAMLQDWTGSAPVLAGVHGQTVLHRRPKEGRPGDTLQLIDAEGLVSALGLPMAYDFRTKDVVSGGEGAPLAPAYHSALLARLGDEPAVVLNLGGVANITGRMSDGTIIAFDTGPANGPIDEWVVGHGKGTHDEGGRFARGGLVHQGLLAQLMDHQWFNEPPPKSLDRYDFSANLARGLTFKDGAATLTAFSAHAVAAGVAQLPERPAKVIVCGGGRHNPVMMEYLQYVLPYAVLTAEDVGWRGDSIEAEAFAFLAARRARELPISWPMTTGVQSPITGGKLISYPDDK